MPKKNDVRLSPRIRPVRYTITLKPDLERFRFEGEETIRLRLDHHTRVITLHASELAVGRAEVLHGQEKVFASKITYDKKRETVTFTFPKILPKGALTLRLVFTGILNDKMRGFYRSAYTVDGKKEHLATTQFEATDARRAFPCFDEPAQKAVFDVNLIVPEESVAISNTIPTASKEHESGYKIVSFAPTPKMSTYLLAFIVGKFEYLEGKTKSGVLVRVFVTKGKKHQAKFALDCALKVLPFFERYFGIRYPLPVLDLIAIPDFAAGAMENWGAITYRESALLIDPDHSSAITKQWVALVIAHELAHQWFGNLVTMEWWTHLWLNEGFASYLEYVAVDHLFPKWDIWTQFANQDLGRALELDALKHSHPVEVDVHDPNEISEIFDAVSYSKGASLIRMLADYLGERDFRSGLSYYLKKHSYKNTSTVHLWQAFAKISGKPVEELMAKWTKRTGYPLLHVSRRAKHFELRQRRFFSSPLSARIKDATTWPIPIRFKTDAAQGTKTMLMQSRKHVFSIKGNWIKANSGEFGVFRTMYSPELMLALKDPIVKKHLDHHDRLGLIRDAFAASEAGLLNVTDALTLAKHYENETDYTVWVELASGLADIKALIAEERFHDHYNAFARTILTAIAKKVGWEKRKNESHAETLLRSLALAHFGIYGDPQTVARAKRMFASINTRKNSVPPDLRGAVYSITAHHGARGEHEKMSALYTTATLHEEKNRLGRALAHFPDKKLLERTLVFSLSKHVRVQDTISIVASVLANPRGRELAWEFLRKKWNIFFARYGGQHGFSSLLSPAGSFTTRAKADEIRRFFKTHTAPGAERTIRQAIEKIHANEAWLKRERKNLETFLKSERL